MSAWWVESRATAILRDELSAILLWDIAPAEISEIRCGHNYRRSWFEVGQVLRDFLVGAYSRLQFGMIGLGKICQDLAQIEDTSPMHKANLKTMRVIVMGVKPMLYIASCISHLLAPCVALGGWCGSRPEYKAPTLELGSIHLADKLHLMIAAAAGHVAGLIVLSSRHIPESLKRINGFILHENAFVSQNLFKSRTRCDFDHPVNLCHLISPY